MEDQQGLWESPIHGRLNSSSSTPYESAACSPGSSTDRTMPCFFSASTPTCPVKVTLDMQSSTGLGYMTPSSIAQLEESASDNFDFSSRFSDADHPWSPAPMSSADELFYNGQIRPLWYPSEDLYLARTDNDDDSHFDFQSSADYKFTMLSLHQSHVSALNELPQYGGSGFNSRYYDQEPEYVQAVISHVNADVVRAKGDGVKETAESLPRQSSMPQDMDVVVKHVMKVKVEECRERRAGISSIRRTCSLSPLRVFHMDDEVPRQSVDDSQSLESARECHGSVQQEDKWEGDEMVRRKGVRLTLKELLHASEQADQGPVNERQARLGSKHHRKAHMETKLHESSAFRPKSSPKHRLEDRTKGPNHVLGVQAPRSPRGPHYFSPRVNSEHMRRQTFLPYRHGLLACLGFTSKRYRSVAGIRSLHTKSQGMRWK